MNPLPEEINHHFISFAHKEISIEEFENWVYTSQLLEQVLEQKDYFDLISMNYSGKYSRSEVNRIIEKYVDFGAYETKRLQRLLACVIERDVDLPNVLRELYHLYCIGYYFLQKLALEYGLLVEVPPLQSGAETWEELSEESQNKLLSSLLPGAIEEAQKVLDLLRQGEIILTGIQNDFGQYDFEYKRSDTLR